LTYSYLHEAQLYPEGCAGFKTTDIFIEVANHTRVYFDTRDEATRFLQLDDPLDLYQPMQLFVKEAA
jgi:hypothetical protein